jgi:hypothetical protein
MSDGRKSCLGFVFLIIGMLAAIGLLVVGGTDALLKFIGGDGLGFDLKTGAIVAGIVFILFFALALVMFISIKDLSWLPAIVGGVYTVLPDLIVGPEDDVVALVLGVAISGFLAYRQQKKGEGLPEIE